MKKKNKDLMKLVEQYCENSGYDKELLKETVIVRLSNVPTVCVKNPDRHQGDGMTVDTPMKPIFTFTEDYIIEETYYTKEYFE